MSVNHDSFVQTTLEDNSIVTPTPEPTPTGFTYLQPFFSHKGLDNVIQRFYGVGTFEKEYGSDISSVKKYGHGGLIAREVLSGGGVVDGCRLMPADSVKASLVLGVAIGTVGERKFVRLVTKAYKFSSSLDTNLLPYKINALGAVITVNPTPNPDATAPLYYDVYPLIASYAKGRGVYGNDIGIEIKLDTSREGKNKDGRRYSIKFYDGSTILGDAFEFISASFNPDAVTVPGSLAPDSYDVVFGKYTETYNLPVESFYSPENFETIVTELENNAGLTEPEVEKYMIDIINGVNSSKTTPTYSYITFESAIMVSGIIRFTGGNDGSLDDEDSRELLLIDFYSGRVDPNIFDCRIIDAGVTLDAWFPINVKKAMAGVFGETVRDDIFVYLDLGPEIYTRTAAVPAALDLISSVSHPYGSVAINIHNGVTRNRSKNIRTSGNYEVASALPTLYRTQGPFSVHAGYLSGRVKNMTFDFYPRVIKDNLEIAPLRDSNLLFAMKLDRSKDFFFMSDDSQYKTDYSVLGSTRNLIFAGEVIRTVKKVLVKYSFHPDNASGAITQSTGELGTIFSGRWFPANIPVKFNIFQTRNDKINKTASVSVAIQFPDVIETWKVTITANRQPLE